MTILQDICWPATGRLLALALGLVAAASPVAGLQGTAAPAAPALATTSTGPVVEHSRIRLKSGVELHVAQSGPPDGVPVVLLHGITDSWFSWTRVLDELPDGVRAIMPTQRGHGDSEKLACCYRLADFAADVAALMDALAVPRAHVVGHSMGGFIAQRFAIEFPERVDRLVLLGSATTVRNDAALEFNAFVQQLADPVDTAFIREFQIGTTAVPLPAEFFEGVVRESAKLPARIWRDVLGALLAPDAEHDQSRIRAPTLVVSGAQDGFFPPAEQEKLARTIPGARLLIYAEAAHSPNWEVPERFAADAAAFLGLGKSLRDAPDRFIELGDVSLRYRDLGGAGDPVILLHGYSNDIGTWTTIADSLRADFRVIALDLRGFGKSRVRNAAAPFGRAMATDVVALLDSLAIPEAHIVGFSLGGLVAASVARAAPDRVTTLTLLAPPMYPDSAGLAHVLAPHIRDLRNGAGLTSFFRWVYPDAAADAVQRMAARAEAANDPTVLLETARQMGGLVPDSLQLRLIAAPTIVAVGTADPLLERGRYTVMQLLDARLIPLPDGNHGTPIGRPAWIAAFQTAAARARPALSRQ
ncbi:MAG TPA: alpha/beta fold hydrolase [Longimicrobiales bacterium]